jgi:hypothetical protein
MNPIDSLFARLQAERRKAFMPFVTAGDPDLAFTRRFLPAVADAGADLIEVGFPFSDPIADGPVIQASYTRALARNLRLTDLFDTIRAAVVKSLAHLGADGILGILAQKALDRSEGVRRAVAEALSRFDTPEGSAILGRLVRGVESYVRSEAVQSLGESSGPAAIEALRPAL